ncbi:MAG: YicC family protein [Blastopirellula sp.]|nr:MAG: YicC family protein [Blastopirellula sp.]
MTGYGESHFQENGTAVSIEVRTINNRYFKLNIRGADGYNSLESQIEACIRKQIKRGTVSVTIRVSRDAQEDEYQINQEVLGSYLRQLRNSELIQNPDESSLLNSVLQLPGVIREQGTDAREASEDWPLIQKSLNEALTRLNEMRQEEGQATAKDLTSNCKIIGQELSEVEKRAPQVVENYRTRITDRLNKILEDYDVETDTAVIVREVGIFAERADIAEETVRLNSHLEQFAAIMNNEQIAGKKLEFLTQEIGRETNTIGSKANDAEIALHVVEMKSAIERIREQIQNIE